MPITDNDLQMLEELLDGELPEGQTETLRRRLSSEPELAQTMDRLRSDRQMRARLFTMLEPTDQESESLVFEVRRGVRREDVWSSRMRSVRQLTKLAAAIVIVFMAGWLSRERLVVGPAQQAGNPIGIPPTMVQNNLPLPGGNNNVQLASSTGGLQTVDPGRLQFRDMPSSIDLTKLPVAERVDEKRQVYQLIIRDPSGKLFVLQTLDPRVMQPRGIAPPQYPRVPSQQMPAQGQGILVGDEGSIPK